MFPIQELRVTVNTDDIATQAYAFEEPTSPKLSTTTAKTAQSSTSATHASPQDNGTPIKFDSTSSPATYGLKKLSDRERGPPRKDWMRIVQKTNSDADTESIASEKELAETESVIETSSTVAEGLEAERNQEAEVSDNTQDSKRGRKTRATKKEIDAEAEPTHSESETSVVEVATKRRGRTAKANEANETNVEKPKRGRGRPKKEEAPEVQRQPARGRGRRKVKDEPAMSVDASSVSVESAPGSRRSKRKQAPADDVVTSSRESSFDNVSVTSERSTRSSRRGRKQSPTAAEKTADAKSDKLVDVTSINSGD